MQRGARCSIELFKGMIKRVAFAYTFNEIQIRFSGTSEISLHRVSLYVMHQKSFLQNQNCSSALSNFVVLLQASCKKSQGGVGYLGISWIGMLQLLFWV